MPRKVFVAGEILTAADVNTNLMDQAVMSFAGTAARGSAIPSPSEGMVAYIADQDLVQIYDGSAWKNSLGVTGGILQVVSTAKTDTFSTTSSSYVDVTGLSATITPSLTGNKILIIADVTIGLNQSGNGQAAFVRVNGGGADLYVGDAASNRTRAAFNSIASNASYDSQNFVAHGTIVFLASPATTSPVTFQVQLSCNGGTAYLNRSGEDTDAAGFGRLASSITVLEVAA